VCKVKRFGLSSALLCALMSAQHPALSQAPSAQSPIWFRDVAHKAGIDAVPPTEFQRKYLLEMMGGGVALFDCDNDGKLDILTVNDSSVDGFLLGGDLMVSLYHQDASDRFSDITLKSGLTTRGWGMGIAIGDFDNDGLPDIYVTGYGHNVLYRNLGNCKFQDVTERAGVSGGGFSVGVAWADYDRDGNLDLFVSRYVNTDIEYLPQPGRKNFGYKGLAIEIPLPHDGQADLLYHNRGDGTFEEVSAKAGVSNPGKQLGMGVVWADYDNDGWPDLFVTNDMGPNFLFRNKHDGTFEDLGVATTVAVGEEGDYLGNMAGDFADISHDGTLGLLITRYAHQPLSLYHNDLTQGGFVDDTYTSGLGRADRNKTRWGAGFADFDNDGWNDILVANGNFTPVIDSLPADPRYLEPVQLFRSNGNSTYSELSDVSGLNEGELKSRRGTAFGDINNDGNIDVVMYNVGTPPSLFLNETKTLNHRVLFRLVGTRSNKGAIGARVTVTTSSSSGATNQIGEVRGGGSYLSSNDQRLHFGLGNATVITRIQIRWPGGLVENLNDVPADAIYTLVEGRGITETRKFAQSQEQDPPHLSGSSQ
jgi:enediyne biosynthesis protein E4